MSLVIAVILIVCILGKLATEKGGKCQYEQDKKKREEIISDFEDRCVNRLLEERLWAYVRDENNYESVIEEVFAALSEMEHFKNINTLILNDNCIDYSVSQKKIKEQKEEMLDHQRLAVEIMLANRGNVTNLSLLGEFAHIYPNNSHELLKHRAFEKVEWIQKTLNKQGIDIVPVYIKNNRAEVSGKYYWRGSSEEVFVRTCGGELDFTVLPFDRSLIEKKRYKIPKPYYEE